MRKATSIRIVNYVEADYGSSKPLMHPDCRGDERALECHFALGKSEIDINIAEQNAAHTLYSLYLCFPDNGLAMRTHEADLYLSRRQILALPSMIQGAIREGDAIGMFDRGPSLWLRRETSK